MSARLARVPGARPARRFKRLETPQACLRQMYRFLPLGVQGEYWQNELPVAAKRRRAASLIYIYPLLKAVTLKFHSFALIPAQERLGHLGRVRQS